MNKRAVDFEIGQTFTYRGETFTVSNYETDDIGGVINMWVKDKLGNEIKFNPYAYVD